MQLLNAVYCFLLLTLVSANRYLISLKSTETLDSFFKYDINYPLGQRAKAFVSDMFSIGNFSGFSGDFSKSVMERLKKCPMIADITPDINVKAYELVTQEDAPRHLARLSQRKKLMEDFKYVYNSLSSGLGVNAYVLDSGIEITHPEFEKRAKIGRDFTEEGSGDINWHGTHVAGIIGSKLYGVSKNVNIIEIKALDQTGAGSLSTVIAAIEFAVNHRKDSGKPGVANLSLGAVKNKVLNMAIEAAVDTGLVVVVAAGNSNVNACMTSPASADSAITVGAIDDHFDSISSFSNWGECVDIFASGTAVHSVNARNTERSQVLSGTSMSAPIISGLAANLLSEGVPPASVKDTIIELSTKKKIPRSSLFFKKRTPNRIAYNGMETMPDEESDSESDSDED